MNLISSSDKGKAPADLLANKVALGAMLLISTISSTKLPQNPKALLLGLLAIWTACPLLMLGMAWFSKFLAKTIFSLLDKLFNKDKSTSASSSK